jgi:hypothetical protein
VMNEPPPASAFWVPAQTATTNNRTKSHIGAPELPARNASALIKTRIFGSRDPLTALQSPIARRE